jgi:DNA-binding response OmpR family regulator
METLNNNDLWKAPTAPFSSLPPKESFPLVHNNGYTILVVDHEQSSRELISQYLKFSGYNVLVVESGVEALALIELYPIDLIFLDIMLPMMDGLAVCAAIRKTSEIPIVMLTTHCMLEYAARAFQLGADGCISKPFALNTLNMRIQGLLHGHL